jgi:aldose sugar dehydrogenase
LRRAFGRGVRPHDLPRDASRRAAEPSPPAPVCDANPSFLEIDMTLARRLAAVSAVALAAGPALALEDRIESDHYAFDVETVAEGLVHPWGLAFLPDGRFLVTERDPGTIRVGGEDGLSEPVHEVEALFSPEGETPRSQAGLFDIKLHPDFDDNRWVYWAYSRETERGSAVVVQRGVWDGENDSLGDVDDVWVMQEDDQDASALHFGGRMAWGADGHLFLSIGERRNLERAQDLEDQAGSILRMTEGGEAPEDNPDFDEDANAYVFAAGIRNTQALTVHPHTGELWAVDHGPEGGDEINLIVGGNNYGWPFITGGEDYSGAPVGVGTAMEGKTSAVHIFEETVAPSGLTFVWNEPGFENWQGDMLIGGLVAESVVRVRLEEGAVVEEEWIEIGRRIRDVHLHDGALWLLTEHEDGEVLRLRPTAD